MQRDINFFSVYSKPIDAQGNIDKATLIGIILISSTILVIAGIWLVLLLSCVRDSVQITDTKAFLSRKDVIAAQSKLNDEKLKLQSLNQYQATAKTVTNDFKKMPVINSSLLDSLAKCEPADVQISDLNFTGYNLSITCTANNENSAAVFVHELKSIKQIAMVTYDGNNKSGDKYLFSITCVLNEDGVK